MVGRVWGALAVAVLTAVLVAGNGGGSAHADEVSGRLGPPAPVPADSTRLLGRWVPVSGAGAGSPRPPFVDFGADGRWTGSDGCNGQGGRWTLGRDGAFHATADPSTMMACDGEPVGRWLTSATRAGFASDELVLRGASGVEQGRLRRAA
jgi:heat shock protein HslJ